MVGAVLALAAIGGALFAGGVGASAKRGGAATAPATADVDAARACQAFNVFLADAGAGSVPKADGEALVDSAGKLLAGAGADQAAGRPLPRWAQLGADLVSATNDVVHGDSSSLKTDGAAAAAGCQQVPAAAARAGGFVSGGA